MSSPALQPALLTSGRALRYYNLFRVASIAALLMMTQWAMPFLEGRNAWLSGWLGMYAGLAVFGLLLGRTRLPLSWSITLSLAGDIALLVLYMHEYGGVQSGFGMLLLPFLAVAGMLVPGRLALFHAAMATLAVFASVLADMLHGISVPRELFQAALLAIACFVTSSTTWLLARKARESERLAAARGDELASLNRVNALVLQALREAVVVVDGHGVVRHFNSRAERLLGRVQRDTTVPELMPLIVRWQRTGCPPYAQTVESNVRGQQLIGRMVPLEENGTRLLVLFLQNMAEQAAEAQRMKLTALGRLTANIAHEIRNPLAAISHASELLAEDASDPASRRLAGMVQDNTRRINRLVEEVLQLNRRDRVQPESIELGRFLPELLDGFAMANPDTAGRILTRYLAPVTTRFDRGHLQQILTNLLSNGWRHSSATTGAVRIDVSREAISVIDDGPGIAPQAQSQLFEPFFTTESSGTGLGLYIARELAEANGARLDYLPPGGCFRLILPKET